MTCLVGLDERSAVWIGLGSSHNFNGGRRALSSIDVPLVRGRFGQTARKDAWWIWPLVSFLGLSTFVVYSTWAAFQGNFYRFAPYLSPFYSPELFGNPADAWFGAMPTWIPGCVPL